MFSSVCNCKNFLLYLFILWNCFVNDLSAVSKFEYQINPAQGLGKSFLTFRTCPQKFYFGTIWQPDYQYSLLFCKKCLSAKLSFTINTHSNKRPLKKLTKMINARGLYLEYYVWNLQNCNSFILLWPLRTSQTANDICSNYVVKFAKWICKKVQIFKNSCFTWLLTCLTGNGIHSFSIMTTFYCLTSVISY